MTDSCQSSDDRGWLRLLLAVPVTLFTLITIGAAGAVVALWSMPSVRQVVRWWWIGPALVMAGAAAVRWSLIG
ncbi:hypothetical protein ACFWM5_06495 [Streptomyces bobili]|uniref:hypothetical protein n=1 Tax=Streptomyces bobili TaxID=67280 RepID=UPI003661C31E